MFSTVNDAAAPAAAGGSTVVPPVVPKPLKPALVHEPHKGGHRDGVKFGNVELFEHERVFMESPVSGAPRLAQGALVQHSLRRMDSLEREREPERHDRETIQPLTPAQRKELAGFGRELLADSLSGQVAKEPPVPPPRGEFDAALENWHLGPDGSIYHNGGVTSKVCAVSGRVVTTAAHGSKYRLQTLKSHVREVMERLSMAFDPENPLANPAALVYAWTIVQVTPEMEDCRTRIQQLESKLSSFGPSVRDCFATIDKAFQALGFSIAPA